MQDEGSGFDLSALPDPRAPENLMKPSGRGIFMMQMFMNDVRFRQTEDGVTVVMTKCIGSPKKADFSQMDGLVDQGAEGIWWAGFCDPRLTQVASTSLEKQGPFSVAWSVAYGALRRLAQWFGCRF